MSDRYNIDPKYDYAAFSDPRLLNSWQKKASSDPQRYFIYQEMKKRYMAPPSSSWLERFRFGLKPNEVLIYSVTGGWRSLITNPSFNKKNLGSCFAAFCLSFMLVIAPAISGYIIFKNALPIAGWFYFLSILLGVIWLLWPFSTARYYLTNQRVGHGYVLLGLINIRKRAWDLSTKAIYASNLSIDAEVPWRRYYLSECPFKKKHLVGSLFFVNNEVDCLPFSLKAPEGQAFLKFLRLAAAEDCRGLYIPNFVYRNHCLLFTPDQTTMTDFADQNKLINYYNSLTKTAWFARTQPKQEYAQVKDLCVHFIKNSQTKIYQNKQEQVAASQWLRTGESEVFKLPFKRFFLKKIAIFTNQRLIVTDKKFNLLSSDDYQEVTHISINRHKFKIFAGSKTLISLKRYWPLVPVLETAAMIIGLDLLCLHKKLHLVTVKPHVIVRL